jgi:hypothetical protein
VALDASRCQLLSITYSKEALGNPSYNPILTVPIFAVLSQVYLGVILTMMMSDDDKDDTRLSADKLQSLLHETGCDPVDSEMIAAMKRLKVKLQAAIDNPCAGTITGAVREYDFFHAWLLHQQTFDQYLLAGHIKRQLPLEWPLWINYTRNFYARFERRIE